MRPYFLRAFRPASLLTIPLALTLAAPIQLSAQLQDPANLTSEHVSPQDLADTLPLNHDAPALQQLLRKLRTRASFMLIVAHPDDEDNGMLTFLSRGQGARVATLTLNRGEGGQNLMSADFEDALGLIRTQELLISDRYMGVDQFFGTEVDFGFSKTKEEAFAKWTHERVLYDAVRAVRLYRPLVIASVFIGAPSDGHGQHQVSGQIAQEVFNAAGDPTVFPDQIAAGLQPWQPLKVYARAPFGRIDEQGMYDYAVNQYVPARFTNYVTGKVTDTLPKPNVTIPEGDTDPLLNGVSYAQLGREGRVQQRSQMSGAGGPGGGRGGRADVSYHRYGSKLNQPDGDDSGLESGFYEGIDTSIPGIATLAPEVSDKFRPAFEKIDHDIAEAQRLFDPNHLELTAPPLRSALIAIDASIRDLENKSVNDLPAQETYNLLHELRIKRVQCNNALILAHGLTIEATLADGLPGQGVLTTQKTVPVKVKVSMADKGSVHLDSLQLSSSTGKSATKKPATGDLNTPNISTLQLAVPDGLPPTQPYFSRPNIEQPYYDVAEPSLRNAPATPAPLTASATLNDDGVLITLVAAVAAAPTASPSSQSIRQPVAVVPRLSVSITPAVRVVSTRAVNKTPLNFTAEVHTNVPNIKPRLELNLPPGWTVTSPGDDFLLPHVGDTHTSNVSVVLGPVHSGQGDSGSQVIQAYALEPKLGDKAETNLGYRSIGYPGLTTTNVYRPANLRVIATDFTTAPNLNIAYLSGTGDDVPSALEVLGAHVHMLTVADITAEKLKPYDAVVLGVRAYAAHPELAGAGSLPLLDYTRHGGVVIVQMNNGRYGNAEAPFPITVANSSGDHAHDVVDESQPVTILAPDSPLLTWPNRITSADFDGWVAERGHSFAGSWAPEFQPLVEVHDPGQDPQRGGLLIAHAGQGYYIYCGLALFRQLPEGVPGAYRLLANLISASKNPHVRP
jgi:LmbE family N-acetylglucosaminyl deacetylase